MGKRVGGLLFVKVDGVQVQAKATSFTFNEGIPKKEAVIGIDGTHGYKEIPVVAFLEGVITDSIDLDVSALVGKTDATVTASLPNGKLFVLRQGWYAGDVDQTTEEGEIPFRFEGLSGEVVS